MKKIIAILLTGLMLMGCTQNAPQNDKLTIVTTFFPLYDFAKIIGGEDVEVINLMGSGVSAHDYEPSIQDRITLERADIFVYNGAGMEGWVDKTLDSMDISNIVVVNTADKIALLETSDHDEDEHEEEHEEAHEDEHDHDHGGVDPHIWLDPVNASKQAEAIYNALVTVDPDNKDEYTTRFESLRADLEQLDQEMQEGMKTVSNPIVVMNHRAFAYMANRYGFTIESISGIIPDSEPSAAQMTDIIDIINEYQVHTILMESTSNQKVIDALTKEIQVTVLVVDTLEAVSNSDNEHYVNIMQKNIENLLNAMK